MAEKKKADKKVFKKYRSKISVSDETSQPQVSSATICTENGSTPKKSVLSKLFSWNREKPRPTGEYVEKMYDEPFNIVAPELRVIGGLGPIRCVEKQKQNPLINRPTLVQKVCHTKTKLLPNFNLTEQLRPVACRKKTKLNVVGAAERVKFAENLPTPTVSPVPSETKEIYNHRNPFNLDLNALSAYQKQKHNAEEMERRRNYQIIRRTMETKALKTEGVERIKQEARNEKFKLPAFFKVIEDVESETSTEIPVTGCRIVSTIDKPKNREIVELHYQHKEEKLRQRILKTAERDEKLAREIEDLEKEKRENLVFRLADESLPASECDANENVAKKELPPTYEKFDYPVNESELMVFKRQLNEKSLDVIKRDKLLATMTVNNANDEGEEIGIPCGQKIGNRIILRSFHDRICSEPRGESNYYHLRGKGEYSTCLTHNQWLDSIANDPEILKEPPRGKLLSTLKVEREPNDDKTYLFDDASKFPTKKNVAIVSSIKQHIQQLDEKMKIRMSQSYAKEAKSHMCIVNKSNNKGNQNSKRYQRMKFMGIPVRQTSSHSSMMKVSHDDLKAIVAKISQTSVLLSHEISSNDKSTPKRKHSTAKILPEVVKLIPKVPELDCTMEDEKRELSKLDKFAPFSKAQPRGTNARNLRADKSLPWIEDELNATKVKLQKDSKNGKTFSDGNEKAEKASILTKGKIDGNPSAIKKTFNEIITSKFQDYNPLENKLSGVENNESGGGESENTIQFQSVESSSSLSSEGTYFTNDSGSVLITCDQNIPIRELNAEKKFLNRSLVTTEEKPPMEPNPYFIPKVEQYEMIKAMQKPKDRFHTYKTRSCANIRERIHIKSPEYDEELFGTEAFKMVAKMATDMDEYYQSEIYSERSHTTFVFKPRTEIARLREAFGKKMEIYWMKEQIIKGQIETMRHEAVMKSIKKQINDYDTFLDAQREKVYRNTNRTMQDVKKFYATTDELRKQCEYLETQVEPLKMEIFCLGTDFVRCTIIQNFQYLLKPMEWRKKFDYIHRTPDGELEAFKESIANRETVNLWNRESVTVFTIKDYIENVYMKTNRKPKQIFDSGKAVLTAYKELQSKSCRALLQFQSIAQTLADTEKECINLEEKNTTYINKLDALMKNLGRRRVFMEKRLKEIKSLAQAMVEKPLEESISAVELRTTQGLIDIMHQQVLSNIVEEGTSSSNLTQIEKTSALEARVFGIFEMFDKFPRKILTEIEAEVRKERILKLRDANKAFRIEMELKQRIDQFERCIAKPPQKQKREGKLPMSVIPKKAPKPKPKKPLLTPLEEDYARAFTEFGADGEIKFDEDAKKMIDRIKNESTPFYVDHLLDTLGVRATKDVHKSSEIILSDEEKTLKYKDVLPRVLSQVKLWESRREKIKQENIRKTPYLYE